MLSWGEANMRLVRGAYFRQFGSIASLPTETTDGEILVTFLAHIWPQKSSQSAKFKKKILGVMPPDPPYLVHTYAHAMAVPVRNSWRRACVSSV